MRALNALIYSTVSVAALATAAPSFAQTPRRWKQLPRRPREGEATPAIERADERGRPGGQRDASYGHWGNDRRYRISHPPR